MASKEREDRISRLQTARWCIRNISLAELHVTNVLVRFNKDLRSFISKLDKYKSQTSERICLAGLLLYIYLSAEKYQTMRTECCLAERNSAHVLVSAGISRLLDTFLSGIHNAKYIVNSIVCAVILVRGSD